MQFLGALAALVLTTPVQDAAPVLWLTPEAQVLVQGKPLKGARLTKGAGPVETPFGIGLDFDGTKGGLLIPDLPALALTDSMTISTWVYLRSYVNAGPNAQIFFRGDDRNGLDPYSLVVHTDGMIAFEICSTSGGDGINYRIPLKQWTHVTASFDAVLAEAKLWIDGKCVKTSEILHQPFLNLAKGSAPGLGIGNVQNDKGPHNQPLNGTVADLRVYNAVLKPTEAGFRPLRTQ